MRIELLAIWMVFFLGACGPDYLSKESMMDPETCKTCHAKHYEEWSGSMHAYASTDPVFLAMNARGQRETNGELGDFCVNCHAPMAVKLGLTTDGLNLPDLPKYVQGVTCYFCHSVAAVEGTHNNPLKLANDLVMRGAYNDPTDNEAHASAYSSLLDRNEMASATLCGSCHDIVTPAGVHIERTFDEWQNSLFSKPEQGDAQTCGNCHMAGRNDVAADVDGVPLRRVHNHMMVGVDVALTEFPGMSAQLEQIQRELDYTLLPELCVVVKEGEALVRVTLENLAAGHSWPSGATQDRRTWIEVIAYDAEDNLMFQSGVVADGEALTSIVDPFLWRLGDRIFNEEGKEVHMFWEAASVQSELLRAPTTHNPLDPQYVDVHLSRDYELTGAPTRVTMRVRIRPLGLDLIDDLIQSGDLDPVYRDMIRTFDLAYTGLEWLASDGTTCVPVPHN